MFSFLNTSENRLLIPTLTVVQIGILVIGLNSYKFTLKTSNDEILTAKQIQKLQRENAQHKEKTLIKKVIAIFILHPNKD